MSSLAVKIVAPPVSGFELPVTSDCAGDPFYKMGEFKMRYKVILITSLMALLSACASQQACVDQPKEIQKSKKAAQNNKQEESDNSSDATQAAINSAASVINNAVFWGTR